MQYGNCPSCNKKIPVDGKFCSECGELLGNGWYKEPQQSQGYSKRAAVLFCIGLFAILVWYFSEEGIVKTANTDNQQKASTQAQKKHLAEKETRKQLDLEEKTVEYMRLVTVKTNELPLFDPNDYTADMSALWIGFDQIESWVEIYEEGAGLPITDEQEQLRQKFRIAIVRKQKQALPIFRDAYGPIMRKVLWELDATAKTIGPGFTTVEFVAGMFAANKNIKTFQEELSDTLHKLRFKKSIYKWHAQEKQYTSYTIHSLSDDELVMWFPDGKYRKVR